MTSEHSPTARSVVWTKNPEMPWANRCNSLSSTELWRRVPDCK